MPASILSEGKLSNLQLEAIVYGCQRHLVNLPCKPVAPEADVKVLPTPTRAGFLLGDGAGMGKGRTLAGFVVENIARGRKRHIWVSVSSDLYDGKRALEEHSMILDVMNDVSTNHNRYFLSFNLNNVKDAKRDLSDLGFESYAEENCFLLGKLSYENLSRKYPEGVMFATYSTLIGKTKKKGQEMTRLDQLIQWCGGDDFDGLIM
jgi:hypothetical protein